MRRLDIYFTFFWIILGLFVFIYSYRLGVGVYGTFRMESLNRSAKLNMIHVPLNGSADTLKAVLGKHILVGVLGMGSALPHIEAGSLIPLFSFDPIVIPSLDPKIKIPDFDTVFGNTIPNLENSIFLIAPGKTPKDTIQILEKAAEKMTKTPEFVEESRVKLVMEPQFVPSKIVMEERLPKLMASVKEIMKEIGMIK